MFWLVFLFFFLYAFRCRFYRYCLVIIVVVVVVAVARCFSIGRKFYVSICVYDRSTFSDLYLYNYRQHLGTHLRYVRTALYVARAVSLIFFLARCCHCRRRSSEYNPDAKMRYNLFGACMRRLRLWIDASEIGRLVGHLGEKWFMNRKFRWTQRKGRLCFDFIHCSYELNEMPLLIRFWVKVIGAMEGVRIHKLR